MRAKKVARTVVEMLHQGDLAIYNPYQIDTRTFEIREPKNEARDVTQRTGLSIVNLRVSYR